MIKKIVVIGDILRGNSGLDYNTPWIYEICKYFINSVSNVSVVRLTNKECCDFCNNIKKICNATEQQNGWVSFYSMEPTPEILNKVHGIFQNSFVISFELHPLLEKAFKHCGIQYLKIINHPIRYMDDLILGFSSNNSDIYEALKKFQIHEENYRRAAALVKAESGVRKFRSKNNFKDNSAVFFAQTNVDCSLIENNIIHSLYDYMDKFEELTRSYDHVYYKIHPMGRNQELINNLKKIPNVIIPKPNFFTPYDLISASEIKKCVSISSGALYEAKYFGKEIEYYYKQPFKFENDPDVAKLDCSDKFIPVYKSFWTPEFWHYILKNVVATKEYVSLVDDGFSNSLRRIINLNWGYRDYSSAYLNRFLENLDGDMKKIKPNNSPAEVNKSFFRFFKKII